MRLLKRSRARASGTREKRGNPQRRSSARHRPSVRLARSVVNRARTSGGQRQPNPIHTPDTELPNNPMAVWQFVTTGTTQSFGVACCTSKKKKRLVGASAPTLPAAWSSRTFVRLLDAAISFHASTLVTGMVTV